jgi:hypothetical protein
MAETAGDDQGRIGSVVVPGMDFGKGGLDGLPEWLVSVLGGVGHQSLAEVGFASFWMTCSGSLEGIRSFNFGAMLRLTGIGEMEMCMPLDT